MKSDSNLLVFNATQKFNQILDRLLPQIWQVVYLLKHLAQLTEELWLICFEICFKSLNEIN